MANKKEKADKPSFLKGVSTEWKMIHWPKKAVLTKQTFIVIVATALITCLCVFADANGVAILKFLN